MSGNDEPPDGHAADQTNDTIDRNNAMGTMHSSMSALVSDHPPEAGEETFMSKLLAGDFEHTGLIRGRRAVLADRTR